MSDITTRWEVLRSRGTWILQGTQLLSGLDLETSVLISLFSDRAALPDDKIVDRSNDPRGFWGDADPLHPLGSRLWLIYRAKQDDETLARAKDYSLEALQWLVDDGAAARIDCITEWTRRSMLGIRVVIYKKDGSNESFNFNWAWQQVL